MLNFSDDWFSHNIPSFQKHLSGLKDLRILEIGSYEGRSAIWMINNLKPKSITLIEPGYMTNGNQILKDNLKELDYKLIEQPSNIAWQDFILEEFDFIYIDGSHTSKNCYFDMAISLSILKRGGIMAVDDYNWNLLAKDGTRPKEAIDLFLERNDVLLLEKGYQVWLQKKIIG